jgi:hypothetical protein
MADQKREKPISQKSDALAISYMQHELLNETRDYLERGRALKSISDAEALDTWVATFEQWFEKSTKETVRNMDDAAAELRLRKLDLPEDRVRAKIDLLSAEIKRRGPDARSDILDQRIDEFLAAYEKPKN